MTTTQSPETPYINKVVSILKKHPSLRLKETFKKACELHEGQMYGNLPYMEHVCQVFYEVLKHEHIINEGIPPFDLSTRIICLQTALFHDALEDCDITYNDIKRLKYEEFDEELDLIIEPKYIYNITNDLGKDRVERNLRTYLRMRDYPISIFVKLCDRLANMKSSKERGSTMFKRYKRELPVMKYTLYTNSEGRKHKWSDPLWDELFNLIEG